jgi:hypothetical protein
MGAIHFSIDTKLAAILSKKLNLAVFIETGTFHGDSVASMRPLFNELHTCELSPELHKAACLRFRVDSAIQCHLGSSPDLLRNLAARYVDRPILYWLDAHWCSADHTAGEESQCPLLEELEVLAPLHPRSVIWIDDARYFMAPPPAPLVSKGWPSFQQVLERLQRLSLGKHYLIFANDTILFYPAEITSDIEGYLREHGADWLAIAHASRILPEAISGREAYKTAFESEINAKNG